jgi:GR25 family glycosyltransferase involved in LPS biosynthesis
MNESYAAARIPAQRLPAIRPTVEDMENGWLRSTFRSLKRTSTFKRPEDASGRVGCLASHVDLLKQIRASGRPREVYLIAEDDHIVAADFRDRLPEVLAYLPKDWDTVRFDCWEDKSTSHLKRLPQVRPKLFLAAIPGCDRPDGRKWKGECEYCGGTAAMLVPYEKISKLIRLWSGDEVDLYDADCMLTRPDFRNYCLNWGLFKFDRSLVDESRIAKDHLG